MEYQKFIPEGWKDTNEKLSIAKLKAALQTGEVLQGVVSKCDNDYNLHIEFDNNLKGIIPKNEIELNQDIKESVLKNKEHSIVQFKVKEIINESNVILSRKAVKQEALCWIKEELHNGNVVCGIVKNIRPFGAFVEIGGGIVGLLHIEDISISRIKTPEERFHVGQKINVMIKSIDKERVFLSHKELLGNWEENIKDIEEKTIVDGIIKETDKYKNGIFVELKPNLVGMAEYKEGLEYGQKVKVLIKKIIKNKRKIKVVIV